jgi:hypothetical protein
VTDVTPRCRRDASLIEEAPVTALTPDCDPDLSNCGSPTSPPGGGVWSTVVLLALVGVAVLAVTGEAVPGALTSLAGGVGLLSALVLARRAVRLAGRAGAAVTAHRPWAGTVHRSRPVG